MAQQEEGHSEKKQRNKDPKEPKEEVGLFVKLPHRLREEIYNYTTAKGQKIKWFVCNLLEKFFWKGGKK